MSDLDKSFTKDITNILFPKDSVSKTSLATDELNITALPFSNLKGYLTFCFCKLNRKVLLNFQLFKPITMVLSSVSIFL